MLNHSPKDFSQEDCAFAQNSNLNHTLTAKLHAFWIFRVIYWNTKTFPLCKWFVMMRQQFRQDRQQHSTYYIHRYIHIYISMYILHTILEVECGIQSVLPVTMVGCTTLDFLAGSVWTSGTLVGFTILKKRKKKVTTVKVCLHSSPQNMNQRNRRLWTSILASAYI